MNREEVENRFKQLQPLYCAVQLKLMNELESPHLMRYSGANIYRVTSRVKTLESLIAKVIRRSVPYDEETFNKIDDIVGARIVCMFQEDFERIHQYLISCGSFEFCGKPEAYLREGMNWMDPDEFVIDRKSSGYAAIHYIARLSSDLVGGNNPAVKVKFEIQVRTLMQEAWAALEHSVGYKNDIPDRIRGYFDSVADLLGLIDRAFQRLKDESNRLQNEMGADRLNDSEPINFYTLKQLAEEEFGIRPVGRSFSELLSQLLDGPIKTIRDARMRLDSPNYR